MPSNAKNPTREIDYLAYLIDDKYDSLSAWEKQFTASCLDGLRKKYPRLSLKQRACLDKMIVKYGLAKDEYCVYGYADRDMNQVMNDTGPGALPEAEEEDDYGDGYDDDIPF